MKLGMNARRIFNKWLLLFLLISIVGQAQQKQEEEKIYVSSKDSILFERYRLQIRSQKRLDVGDLMVESAKFFLGKPYVGGTLEKEPEGLVINLSELDCLTLVENVLALSWTIKQDGTFDMFQKQLKKIRYRNSFKKQLLYTDRLHYTSDWIYENEKKGIVKDMTQEIGGELHSFNLFFMSTHPDSYKQLRGNSEAIEAIVKIEKEVNARFYYYIPQDEIHRLSKHIRQGDIICFVTTIDGLDISHLGIACWKGETLTFIHASSDKKQVIINETSLQDYVQGVRRHCGIMVVRPIF